MADRMHVAVLGGGNVGGTLGRRWAELGHTVVFGTRDPSRGADAIKGGGALPANASLATPDEAVRGTGGRRPDAVLLATPWPATPQVLGALGDALDGIALLDATNPLGPGLALDRGPNGESGAERVQALAPRAKVVKVFNSTGYDNMREPRYDGVSSVMFYAGDDAGAKRTTHALAAALGFDAVDAGALVRARELEHLAMLWISLAFGAAGAPALGRDFAFHLVRRGSDR